jgi:hypothetical protein
MCVLKIVFRPVQVDYKGINDRHINFAVVFSVRYALMFTKVNVIKLLHIVFSMRYDLRLKKHSSIGGETVGHPVYNTTDVMNSV